MWDYWTDTCRLTEGAILDNSVSNACLRTLHTLFYAPLSMLNRIPIYRILIHIVSSQTMYAVAARRCLLPRVVHGHRVDLRFVDLAILLRSQQQLRLAVNFHL